MKNACRVYASIRAVRTGAIAVTFAFTINSVIAQTLTWLGTLTGGLGSAAYGVSAGGRVVVGYSDTDYADGQWRAFRWTASGGMQDLGTLGFASLANGVSANGNAVVGDSDNADVQGRAFLWTASGGMQDLGTLGGAHSSARGVSANGNAVVGSAHNADGEGRAFRWTASGGMQDLGTLGYDSRASGVSADGRVVVGASVNANGHDRAFRWTASGGMQNLGTLGGRWSSALGVSASGTVVVGWSAESSAGQGRAFRWTQSGGMQNLGTLGGSQSVASSVSADGSVVVGSSQDTSAAWKAFRWTAEGGMEDLNAAYASLLTDGSILNTAYAVSSEGRFIVGFGLNGATGRTEAYLLDTCPGGDTDDDCICDDWERNGIDINNDGTIDLDLPALGAQVGRRDIFVEYDSMVGFAPTRNGLDRVVAAFQAQNISLHIHDGGDQSIPEAGWNNAWEGFDAEKGRSFGTPEERNSPNWQNIRRAKRHVFRYCIFASTHSGDASSGLAELPGDDFMVTLGHGTWRAAVNGFPVTWNGVRVHWEDFVVGTFMHELGHVLGLRHGGDTHMNYKPNYHSVMNYLWQVPVAGYAACWALDYSRRAFNTLNENNLSEAAGIGGRANCCVPIGGSDGWLAPERGAVDWNRDGDTLDTHVALDVNGDSVRTTLAGHNDWADLDLCCGPNWADGVHIAYRGSEADLEEMTFTDWLALARIESQPGDSNLDGCVDDADLLAVLFAFGQTGASLQDVNDDNVVDDADLLMVLFNFGEGC